MDSTVVLDNVTRRFGQTTAMDHVSLSVAPGELVCLLGPSGAGKSTLLRTINGLVSPDSGRVVTAGTDMVLASPEQRRRVRRQVGFIFQNFNLIDRLSVLQNTLSGRLGYAGLLPSTFFLFGRQDRERALRNLERVELLHKWNQRVSTLSGGEKQRVAIARAVTQDPVVLLADEPVASLDPKLAGVILGDIQRLTSDSGVPAIVSLHVVALARRYATRIVGMQKGRIVYDGPVSGLTPDVVRSIYGQGDEYGGDL